MKSNVCKLPKGTADFDSLSEILRETEKCAVYNGLEKKEAGLLRLLSEELVEMLPGLLSFTSGEFWISTEGKSFELHTTLTPDEAMTSLRREEILKVSSSGKNTAAKGIVAKIRLAAELMLIDYNEVASILPVSEQSMYEMGIGSLASINFWSLETYRKQAEKKQGEEWDELEKSIIANIADDVLVGITGKSVEIVVKKNF